MHRTVLLTGFDAFGGETCNPSWLAVQALHGQHIGGYAVVAAQLPTVFGVAAKKLKQYIAQHAPKLIICVGQAGGSAGLRLEHIAINWCDTSIPDNAGTQPRDCKVNSRGAAAYFSTLPLRQMQTALQALGLPTELSMSAGSFVCNEVFYQLMQHVRARAGVKAGFIHVPYLPEQAAVHQAPSMSLSDIIRALEICVATAINPP
jgi:pyroglutamyl-peptidase